MKHIMSDGKIRLLENSQALASHRFSQLVSSSEGFTIENDNTNNDNSNSNDKEFI